MSKKIKYIIVDPTGDVYDDVFDTLKEAEKNLKNAVDGSEVYEFDLMDLNKKLAY